VFRSHSNLAYKTLQIKLFITKRNTNCLAVPRTLAGRHHKTLCNRTVKSLNRNGNPLEQKWRWSNVPGLDHQLSDAQLAQELKSRASPFGPWDSTAIRTNSPIIIYCYYYYYYY